MAFCKRLLLLFTLAGFDASCVACSSQEAEVALSGGSASTGGAASGGASSSAPRFDRAWACTDGLYASPFSAGITELTPSELPGITTQLNELLEGVVWTGDRLLFSQISLDANSSYPSSIYEYRQGGSQVFLANSGSNGLAMHPDGTLIAATHGNRNLTRIDLSTFAVSAPLVTSLDGQPNPAFNSPNDLAIRSDGVIYFTDPNWQKWGNGTNVVGNHMYVVQPDGAAHRVETPFSTGLGGPNGVVLSLDEKTIFVGGNGWVNDAAPLAAYPVNPDGSLQPFVKWPPQDSTARQVDGMTIDCAGNLYLTDNDVIVYSPQGEQIGRILVNGGATNLAFGGANGRTLFISKQNGAGLLSIELPLAGLAY